MEFVFYVFLLTNLLNIFAFVKEFQDHYLIYLDYQAIEYLMNHINLFLEKPLQIYHLIINLLFLYTYVHALFLHQILYYLVSRENKTSFLSTFVILFIKRLSLVIILFSYLVHLVSSFLIRCSFLYKLIYFVK